MSAFDSQSRETKCTLLSNSSRKHHGPRMSADVWYQYIYWPGLHVASDATPSRMTVHLTPFKRYIKIRLQPSVRFHLIERKSHIEEAANKDATIPYSLRGAKAIVLRGSSSPWIRISQNWKIPNIPHRRAFGDGGTEQRPGQHRHSRQVHCGL
jgi:hypothetical protein